MSIARDASVPTPVSVGATGTLTASPDATFSVSGPATLWAVLAIGNYDGLARTYGMAWVGGTPANATAWVKVDEALNGSTHAVQVWRATCTGPLSNVSARGTFSASTTNAAVRLTIQPLTGSNTTPGATGRRTTNGTAVAGSVAVAGVLAGSWLILGGCLEEPGAVTPVAGSTETGESVGLLTAATGENTAGAGGSVTVGWSQNFTYGALLALEVTASGPVNEDLTDRAVAREAALDEPSVAVPGALGPEDRSSVSTGTQVGQALALATGQHVEFVIRAASSHREVLQGLVTAVALGQLRITIDGVVVATPSFDGDPFQTYTENVADVALGRDLAQDQILGPTYDLAAIDPARWTDWSYAGLLTLAPSPGVSGVEAFKGRPIYTTLAASSTAAQVQAAIDACPVGQVVVGPTTQVNVTGAAIRVNKGVTLRARAAIVRTGGSGHVLEIGNGTYDINQTISSTNLTAPAPKGQMYVDVASTAGMAVGDVVLVDELLDPSRWYFQPANTDWDQRWPFLRDDGAPYSQAKFRPQSELKEIAGINGNRITFTSPLHMDYRTTFTAQVSRYAAFVKFAGFEGGEVSGGTDGNIRCSGAAYSWIKGNDNHNWTGEGVALHGTFRFELRGSYIHDTDAPHPGGVGYAISLAAGTSEHLVEDNITIRVNKNIVGRCCGAGGVIGYNYFDDALIDYQLNWPEVGINCSHMLGAHHCLMEGNYGQNIDCDFTHGNELFHTYFRNHASGRRLGSFPGLVESSAARCAGLMSRCYNHSFIGNVLGYPGMATDTNPAAWEENWTDSGRRAVWNLGYDGISWTVDSAVAPSTIRDGNRDHFTGLQKWLSNPARALPDSFYRTVKPAFFGAYTWPWVTPSDPAIWTHVLPAKARYEAGTPMATIDDPAKAVPLEVISRSAPATSSAGTAANARDTSYGGPLWGFTAAELGANGWLVYDLSAVAAAKRQTILVALYQGLGDGQQQLNFRAFGDTNVYQNVATAYVLEGATSSSGPWTALATVAQNCQHFKTHRLTFTGYTWLRFRATAGSPIVNMDVYDASNGIGDGIAIFGDSITSNNFSDADVGWPPEWYSKAIAAARAGFFPPAVGGGVPFMTSADAVSVLVNGTGGFTTGLDQAARITYAGVRYAALVYGVNDAGAGPAEGESFRANCQAIINAFRAQGQVVVIASPSWCNDGQRAPNIRSYWQAVGYHLPDWAAGTYALDATVWRGGRAYKATTAGTSVTGPTGTGTGIADGGTARWAYVPTLREDNASDPSVIGGPDLYSLFLNHPEWLSDGIHPNGAGSAQWKAAWVSWALARLY